MDRKRQLHRKFADYYSKASLEQQQEWRKRAMSVQRLETAFILVICHCWTWIPLRRRTLHDWCSIASVTGSESESLEEYNYGRFPGAGR